MPRSNNVPPAIVPCDCCPNRLLASEAVVSRRALSGRALCWHCRLQARAVPTVHAVPAGCAAEVSGTGYGLWNATLRTADGREFAGGGWTDYEALTSARAAATAAGAL